MGGGYRPCQVLNCVDRHRFPNPLLNRNRFNEWIWLCGNPKLVNMDPDLIFRSHRVCHQHFTSRDITSNMYIRPSSVPSQKLPKPLDLAIRQQEIPSVHSSVNTNQASTSKELQSKQNLLLEPEEQVIVQPFYLLCIITIWSLIGKKITLFKAIRKYKAEKKMSNLEDLEDTFGVGLPPPKEIYVDEEEEAKQYMISLYERLNRVREKKDLEKELLESNAETGACTSAILSDDSMRNDEPEPSQIKEFLILNQDEKYKVILLLKPASMKNWLDILNHHERRLKDIMYNLSKIPAYRHLKDRVPKAGEFAQYESKVKIREKAQKNIASRALALCEMEEIVHKRVGSVAFHLKDLSCLIDNATQGVWANKPKDIRVCKILEDLETNPMIIARRFTFNSRQIEDLVQILFSKGRDRRAAA
ncbi:hypothetical protein FQA39_LY14069 [Lamprigera yunnana]|nr:hypothetical protein FQA39_LY14069 [Lamprigera yunnana]